MLVLDRQNIAYSASFGRKSYLDFHIGRSEQMHQLRQVQERIVGRHVQEVA